MLLLSKSSLPCHQHPIFPSCSCNERQVSNLHPPGTWPAHPTFCAWRDDVPHSCLHQRTVCSYTTLFTLKQLLREMLCAILCLCRSQITTADGDDGARCDQPFSCSPWMVCLDAAHLHHVRRGQEGSESQRGGHGIGWVMGIVAWQSTSHQHRKHRERKGERGQARLTCRDGS